MALVSGITAMQYINDANDNINENNITKTITDYWTYDPYEMVKLEDNGTFTTRLVDLKTGNMVAIQNEAESTGRAVVDLSNRKMLMKHIKKLIYKKNFLQQMKN